MLNFLLGLHFVLALLIIALVLMQKHDSDGALGSGGNSANGMFSVRGQANVLTRTTAVLMTIFILNCLVMAKIVKKNVHTKSVIDRVAEESVAIADKNGDQATQAESKDANTRSVNGIDDAKKQNAPKINESTASHSTTTSKNHPKTSAEKTESKGAKRK